MRPRFSPEALWLVLKKLLINGLLILVVFGTDAVKSSVLPQTNVTSFHYMLNTLLDFVGLAALIMIVAPDFLQELYSRLLTLEPFKFTSATVDQITSHEAGHLVAIALLPNAPEKVTVKTSNWKTFIGSADGYISLGRLEFATAEDMLASIKFMLAGNCAELALLGKESLGSDSDLEYAESIAREYLQSFAEKNPMRYPWFRTPKNDTEAAVNARSISTLITDMKEETLKFMEANLALVTEAMEYLKENKNVGNAWCQTVMKRAKLP